MKIYSEALILALTLGIIGLIFGLLVGDALWVLGVIFAVFGFIFYIVNQKSGEKRAILQKQSKEAAAKLKDKIINP